jgi:hypothetical protein
MTLNWMRYLPFGAIASEGLEYTFGLISDPGNLVIRISSSLLLLLTDMESFFRELCSTTLKSASFMSIS